MALDNRRNALMWALGWWFMRRWMRRRTALAVAGVTSGVAARRRPLGAIVGAVLLVGVLGAAFVAWRKLAGSRSPEESPVVHFEPPAPPPEPAAA